MMSVKLEDWKTALSQANFARSWTDRGQSPEKFVKLTYRMAVANNGLGKPEEALTLLKTVIDSPDKSVRDEYERTKQLVKEANEK